MTHDELLARLYGPLPITMTIVGQNKVTDALRAVVELHKPDVRKNCDICTWITNGGLVAYPCPTIQAIEKELA